MISNNMNEKPPILASVALVAGSLGGVALIETSEMSAQQRIPAVYIREEDMPRLDRTDQPLDRPFDVPERRGSQQSTRNYPVRRDYGRNGMLGDRGRGSALPIWVR